MLLSLVLVLAVGCDSQDQQQPTPQAQQPTTSPAQPQQEVEGNNDTMDDMGENTAPPSAVPTLPPTTPGATTFVVTGENFKFVMSGQDNPQIRVKEGDTVRIEFSSTSGFHDWVVDEFNARTSRVKPGTPTAVEFVASKKGTFEYYCSVGTHRQQGMKGSLIVG